MERGLLIVSEPLREALGNVQPHAGGTGLQVPLDLRVRVDVDDDESPLALQPVLDLLAEEVVVVIPHGDGEIVDLEPQRVAEQDEQQHRQARKQKPIGCGSLRIWRNSLRTIALNALISPPSIPSRYRARTLSETDGGTLEASDLAACSDPTGSGP